MFSEELNISSSRAESTKHDYSRVSSPALIAVYDDMSSAPRVITVEPDETSSFIESLASTVYNYSKQSGGAIPYTIIREVAENFIHAQFREAIVSIMDEGNTIRFADQGPGIPSKEKSLLPGFTSATEPMRAYIRGVGSGLPIVSDYLDNKNGTITIEDNLINGAVVTISLKPQNIANKEASQSQKQPSSNPTAFLVPPLNDREKNIILKIFSETILGVTEIHNLTGIPVTSVHSTLTKLEQYGIVDKQPGTKKRILTDFGQQVAKMLQ